MRFSVIQEVNMRDQDSFLYILIQQLMLLAATLKFFMKSWVPTGRLGHGKALEVALTTVQKKGYQVWLPFMP